MLKVFDDRMRLSTPTAENSSWLRGVLRAWYQRRSCLRDSLAYMAVLREGNRPDCLHERLQTGFLDGARFREWGGDDVLCSDCGQVWAATETSDYHREVGAPPLGSDLP